MKVLIVGSGGREHALAWKLKKDGVFKIYAAPGNAGMALSGVECLNIQATDIESLVKFASAKEIDLTLVGPEMPLYLGIVDAFKRKNLAIFGPTHDASFLEWSKCMAKYFMTINKIPTPIAKTFNYISGAKSFIDKQAVFPIVIKTDTLAAGKGVFVCKDKEEANKAIDLILEDKIFNRGEEIVYTGDDIFKVTEKDSVVIEDFIDGREISFQVVTDGKTVTPLETAQDCKPLYVGGPNTGGMGAFSPAPDISDDLKLKIMDTIVYPTIKALNKCGTLYQGLLYFGLIVKDGEPYVLEYNTRFGDPETQALMVRLETSLYDIMMRTVKGTLHDMPPLKWSKDFSTCVVIASEGYPGSYEKGKLITGPLRPLGSEIFHAGTCMQGPFVITNGGRVLCATAKGESLRQASAKAYCAVSEIYFDNMYYRKDIGKT